ncbi:MAG: hypothetical protein AAF689_17770 [Pseudomonadota bacterium]
MLGLASSAKRAGVILLRWIHHDPQECCAAIIRMFSHDCFGVVTKLIAPKTCEPPEIPWELLGPFKSGRIVLKIGLFLTSSANSLIVQSAGDSAIGVTSVARFGLLAEPRSFVSELDRSGAISTQIYCFAGMSGLLPKLILLWVKIVANFWARCVGHRLVWGTSSLSTLLMDRSAVRRWFYV